MKLRRVTDWTLLVGASIEIRQHGLPLCSGHVDAVTDDDTILWLQPPAQNRRLHENAEFYEVGNRRPHRFSLLRHEESRLCCLLTRKILVEFSMPNVMRRRGNQAKS